jgi:hypothetical protein
MKKFLNFVFALTLIFCIADRVKAEELIAEHIDSNELFEQVILLTPETGEGSIAEEETTEKAPVQAAEISENAAQTSENKCLKDVLKNVYNLEVERYDHPEYLFREPLTYNFKPESKMDNIHVWGAFNAYNDMAFYDDGGLKDKTHFNALNIGVDGFLKDNNGDFRIMMGFPVGSQRNYTQTLFADVFVATNKIPHHRIQIGHFRPQIGMEGGSSSYTLGFLGRSQIARNFGMARRLGGRIKGNYSFIDYDFGLYSSDTFFEEWFAGPEFVGWINLKPLAKVDEKKYGRLKIGGGIDAGKRDDNFFVTGAYIGYDYKKFSAEFEWANANGYNGYYGHSRKHATGFYTTLSYMITKKLQILACYDEFTPDKNFSENKKREMTLGLNYFIKGQALRLILNYVFCQNDTAKDSHRIMLGAQILI